MVGSSRGDHNVIRLKNGDYSTYRHGTDDDYGIYGHDYSAHDSSCP